MKPFLGFLLAFACSAAIIPIEPDLVSIFDHVSFSTHSSDWEKLATFDKTWLIRENWGSATQLQKSWYIENIEWGRLGEDQQLFSVKTDFGLDARFGTSKKGELTKTLSTAEFNILLKAHRNELIDVVKPKLTDPGSRPIVTPQTIWWLSHVIPPNDLTTEQRELIKEFGGKQFMFWPYEKTSEYKAFESEVHLSRFIDSLIHDHADLGSQQYMWYIKRQPFERLSIIQKNWVVSGDTAWSRYSDEMKFWSMKKELDLDLSWTRAEFDDQVVKEFSAISAKVSDHWIFLGNESPQMMYYLSLVPTYKLTPQMKTLLLHYTPNHFDLWPQEHIWEWKDFTDYTKLERIDQLLGLGPDIELIPAAREWLKAQQFEILTDLEKDWVVGNQLWPKLSESGQFWSFKKAFQLDKTMTRDQFDHRVSSDFDNLDRQITQHWDDINHGNENPNQLFWFTHIPKDGFTSIEKGWLNNYGHGHFDNYPTKKTWRWEERALSDKASIVNSKLVNSSPLNKLELKWYADFQASTRTMYNLDAGQVDAIMADYQTWIITYYYEHSGSLTAEQKSSGLSYLSTLKSERGIEAFHDLTIRTALDRPRNKL